MFCQGGLQSFYGQQNKGDVSGLPRGWYYYFEFEILADRGSTELFMTEQ